MVLKRERAVIGLKPSNGRTNENDISNTREMVWGAVAEAEMLCAKHESP
jgi:hypothetical protein